MVLSQMVFIMKLDYLCSKSGSWSLNWKLIDMLHNIWRIDSTVLWSCNNASVLASFCSLFVSNEIYYNIFGKTLYSKNKNLY